MKNFLKGNWLKEPEFKKHFREFIVVYVGLAVFGYIIGLGVIGFLGSVAVIVFLALFGRVVYKNKDHLRPKAVRSFWFFIIVFLALVWFKSSIFGILLPLGVIAPLGGFFAIQLIFWFYFLWFWGQERSLPNKGFAYVAATSVYVILAIVVSIILLLNVSLKL